MRYGTSFALGYLLVEFIHGLIALIRVTFRALLWLIELPFRGIELGWDASRRKAFDDAVLQAIEPYLPTLIKKRQKLLRKDDYGVIDNKKWSKELGYFMGRVLLPNLGSFEDYARRHIAYTGELVDDFVASSQPHAETVSRRTEKRPRTQIV